MARVRKTDEILEMLSGTMERMTTKLGSKEAAAGYTAALAVRDNPQDMDGPVEWYKRLLASEITHTN